jgi:glycosyltransferase involved in cell wall biosynthesis
MPRSGDYSVSVVIAAYNAAKWLGKAVESALNQTCRPLEIIVVDDSSEDDTARVVRGYGEKVRLIQQENAGASAARNTGIRAAKGDFIAFLDSDDYWLEDKLEKQLAILLANPSLRWCSGNYLVESAAGLFEAEVPPASDTIVFLDSYLKGTKGCCCTKLIERELLFAAGLFSEDVKQSEDTELWFKIAFRAPELGYVREPVMVVRDVNESSLTKSRPDAEIPHRIVNRLLDEAELFDMRERFVPCAAAIVKWWIILLISAREGSEARRLLGEFAYLFGRRYRIKTIIGSFFPALYFAYLRRKLTSLQDKHDMPQEEK